MNSRKEVTMLTAEVRCGCSRMARFGFDRVDSMSLRSNRQYHIFHDNFKELSLHYCRGYQIGLWLLCGVLITFLLTSPLSHYLNFLIQSVRRQIPFTCSLVSE